MSKEDFEIQHHSVGQKEGIYFFSMRFWHTLAAVALAGYYTVRSQESTQTDRNPMICLKQGIHSSHELISCSALFSWSFQDIWAAGKSVRFCHIFLQILQGEWRSLLVLSIKVLGFSLNFSVELLIEHGICFLIFFGSLKLEEFHTEVISDVGRGRGVLPSPIWCHQPLLGDLIPEETSAEHLHVGTCEPQGPSD